jgi:uncharacterized membrane protein
MSANSGDTTVIRRDDFTPGGRGLEAGRGWAWIAAGWEIFKRAPGVWIGMVVVYAMISMAAAFVPFIGQIATHVLVPVFAAGFMIASGKIDRGEPPQFSDLFAGFERRFGVLATAGAIYVAAAVAIALGVLLAAGISFAAVSHGSGGVEAAGTLLLAMLVIFALLVPLFMAIWFAAPLIVFHGMGAVDAMKASFTGCARNVLPFLVYGAIGLAFGILATIPLMLGWLVFGPVLAASAYAAYKDIYLG